jgi:hypothetical protein
MWFGKNIVWQPVLLCTVSAQIIETCVADARTYWRISTAHGENNILKKR